MSAIRFALSIESLEVPAHTGADLLDVRGETVEFAIDRAISQQTTASSWLGLIAVPRSSLRIKQSNSQHTGAFRVASQKSLRLLGGIVSLWSQFQRQQF